MIVNPDEYEMEIWLTLISNNTVETCVIPETVCYFQFDYPGRWIPVSPSSNVCIHNSYMMYLRVSFILVRKEQILLYQLQFIATTLHHYYYYAS